MELINSKYLKFNFFDDSKIFELIWSKETENMSTNEFKEELYRVVEFVEKYRGTKLLLINTDLKYSIIPDVQLWVNENIFSRSIAAGVKTTAIVESGDLITELSVEQTYDESIAKQKKSNFFTSKADALKWLNSF